MSENTIITVPEERTLNMISMEIRTLHAQAQQVVLGYAIEIGRRLTEAKSMVSHGEWGKWLEEEVNYSKSTANNFMRIFDAYGADQQSLFGPEAKSQTLGNLPYTKALRLLAIPEEEREEFVESNHVEDLSTRELDKLIRERDEAEKAREDAEKDLKDREEELEEARERIEELEELKEAVASGQETLQKHFEAQRKELEDQLQAARKDAEKQKELAEKANSKVAKAEAAASKAQEDLKKLQEAPVPEEAMEKLRRELEEDAQKEAAEKIEAGVKEAKAAAEAAEKAAGEANARAEAAEKKLALADEDTILFKAQFSRIQEEFNKCTGLLLKIEASSPEMVSKLRGALGQALDSMKSQL